MAFTCISPLPIKSIMVSSSFTKNPTSHQLLSKPCAIVCQATRESREDPFFESRKWRKVVSTALAAAVIAFSSNTTALADLNKFEANTRGEFGIGSAAQFGSADLRKAVYTNENFRRANFTSADMRESNFSGSTFNGAYMEKAVAYKANFSGDKYEFWSIKMKTLFMSQDLWDLVEFGFVEVTHPDEEEARRLRENRKKDAKALFYIQQAVHETIFSRIAAATTSMEAWQILKKEFQGSSKVITVKLQTYRREFETLYMRGNESVQTYLSRVSSLVNQMKSYGEVMSEEIVVAKVLRSLTPKFEHIVAAIEESHDLSDYSFDDLMSSLQAHEQRLLRSNEKNEEKAFQVKGVMLESSSFRGRGRGGFRGRGRGRGQGRGRGRIESNEERQIGPFQCHYCKKSGHKEAFCWQKQRDENNHAKFAEKNDEEESKLFMALSCENEKSNDVWFLDSGCSNHMTGARSLFKELDESKQSEVTLGDNKKIQVEGKGTVSIKTSQGNAKVLQEVMLVPSLSHNLLSIGQLMVGGYSLLFDDDCCTIRDKKSDKIIAKVPMSSNKMFPLEVSMIENYAMIADGDNETRLWHLRYGHLHINGLKLLGAKEMVFGLPKLGNLGFCESCVYGKQSRKPFPVGKAWRASKCLELVHADLCGPMNSESLGGSRYFLLFTDDYSRMSWVYFLENKSDAFDRFKKFKAMV